MNEEINETTEQNNKKADTRRPGKGPFDHLEHMLQDLWSN